MDKEKSITITMHEFVEAAAEAMTQLTMKNPHKILILSECADAVALMCHILFDDKEDEE